MTPPWFSVLSLFPLLGTTAGMQLNLHSLQRTDQHEAAFFKHLHQHHATFLTNHDAAFLAQQQGGQQFAMDLKVLAGALFAGEVCVGTPPECLMVVFDTGSTNFWVASDTCDTDPCRQHPLFHANKSTTLERCSVDGTDCAFSVEFGTGKISGYIATDQLLLGGRSGIRIPKQALGVVEWERGDVFATPAFSGLLGLAYPAMAAYDHVPVFDQLIKDGTLSYDAFSFAFTARSPVLLLGAPNHDLHQGDLAWLPVTHKYFWTSKLDDILIDGKSFGPCKDSPDGCKVVFDSGTTLNTVPAEYFKPLLQSLGVREDNTCDSNVPTITYVMSGHRFDLLPDDYVAKGKASSPLRDYCKAQYMALDQAPPQGPVWLLGEVFLRKFYTVFDRHQDRIGVALAKHPESLDDGNGGYERLQMKQDDIAGTIQMKQRIQANLGGRGG